MAEQKSTLPDKPIMGKSDYKRRIDNSKTLVIGADINTYGDYNKWEKIDRNYIGIRDWDLQWKQANGGAPVNWNVESFQTLCRTVLGEKKFKLIIVDGGTRQYIDDMETLFKLANNHLDKNNGLLIYPVTQQTKTFPNIDFLDKDLRSFSLYLYEHTDIEKYLRNNLDLVGFVNVEFQHLGLCYVMKFKKGDGNDADSKSKYLPLFTLRRLKNKSSEFMSIVEGAMIIKEKEIHEWEQKILENNNAVQNICQPKDLDVSQIKFYLQATYGGETRDEKNVNLKISEEKKAYEDEFKNIVSFSENTIKDVLTDSPTNTQLLQLLTEYDRKEKEYADKRAANAAPPDYGSGGIGSPRCISPVLPSDSPPPSPTAPTALIRAQSGFKRKSKRNSPRKTLRKSPRKSVRKVLRKSPRKLQRKSVRKSPRKSQRKTLRKSVRKSPRKTLRKSRR